MGWVLEVQSPTSTPTTLQLLPGTAQVGRAQTTQIRSTHQSVSRVHAEVVVEPLQGTLSEVQPLKVSIVDRSSTGHTFINEQQPGKGNPTNLSVGDVLHFGVDPLRYTLRWRPMVFSISSRLSAAELQSLDEKARSTGLFLRPDWTAQCTHLLLEQFAITPKLLCCIIDGASPVSMAFISELSRRAKEGCEFTPAPLPVDFSPKAAAGPDAAYTSELDAYMRAPRPRRELLRGVWVIFSAKTVYETLSVALSCAGSPVQILTEDQAASSVLQELKKGTAKAMPQEVWIIPTLPPGLGAVLSKPLEDLRCACRVVGQEALVGAILSGSIRSIQDTAQLLPKSELQETFPETQPTHPSHPSHLESQRKKRQLPWEKASLQVKEESFPNTLQEAPSEPPQAPQQAAPKKVKTELEEEEPAAKQRPRVLEVNQQRLQPKTAGPPPALQPAHAAPPSKAASPGQPEAAPQAPPPAQPALRRAQQPLAQARQRESPQAEASLQMQSLAAPTQPKQEEKEEKAHVGTVHSSAPSLQRQTQPEIKAEEPLDLAREIPVHPTNTWLPQLGQKVGRSLVLDGVELPRATWFTTTKRRPETTVPEVSGKPNFKRFRKAQRIQDRPFVDFVPWAPARGLDLFTSQPTLDAESQAPHLAM